MREVGASRPTDHHLTRGTTVPHIWVFVCCILMDGDVWCCVVRLDDYEKVGINILVV